MIFQDGHFISEAEFRISPSDRSLLYGDGLFETVRVHGGRPRFWQGHWERFSSAAQALRIPVPIEPKEAFRAALELIERRQLPESVLRIHLSRGPGEWGLALPSRPRPTLFMAVLPLPRNSPPEGWRVVVTGQTIDSAGIWKSSSRLPYVLARAEARDRGADEGLLRSREGFPAEGSCSNLFWLEGSRLCTPPLSCGILPGVTRAVVLDLARALGLSTEERLPASGGLPGREGLFCTLSTWGVVPVIGWEGDSLEIPKNVERLREACAESLASARSDYSG